jgi:hypothetical protein
MSNAAALALTIASMFVGWIGYMRGSKFAHEIATEIVTGTAHNAPLPLPAAWRWRLLYGRWIFFPISISGLSAFVAAVNMKTANLVSDPGVKLVADFAAFFGASVAVGYLLHGGLEFLHLRGILRDSSRSSK